MVGDSVTSIAVAIVGRGPPEPPLVGPDSEFCAERAAAGNSAAIAQAHSKAGVPFVEGFLSRRDMPESVFISLPFGVLTAPI